MNDTPEGGGSACTEPKMTSPCHDRTSRERWNQRLKNWLWGYDFFISYHWASGGTYAVNLAARLREKGYEVFLDRAEYAMGDKWKSVGEVALRNTQRLVLVATREAVFESKPVEHEVIKFTDRGRHCIPIFFGDTFGAEEQASPSKFPVLDRLCDDVLHIEDSLANLSVGPTKEVVDKLASTHGVMRRRKLRLTITLVVVFVLMVLALTASVSALNARIAWSNEFEARGKEAEAKETAEERFAEMSLQNGHRAINSDDDIGAGLLWYAQTLQTTGERSAPARRSARLLIGGWSSSLPRNLFSHDDGVSLVSFSLDGSTLGTVCGDYFRQTGNIQFWNAVTGHRSSPSVKGVRLAVFDLQGMIVATSHFDGTTQFWDSQTARPRGMPLKHGGGVMAMTLSPDCRTLATASADGMARLWDVETARLRGEPLKHDAAVDALSFSPDGGTLATGSRNQTAWLWDVLTGQTHLTPLKHRGPVNALTFSPDGLTLATASWDETGMGGEAWLWNAVTGLPLTGPLKHDRPVRSVTFSFDGGIIATTSDDQPARIFHAVTGEPLGEPLRHEPFSGVSAVSWRPGSRTLATAGGDGTVRLWDATTSTLLRKPLRHDGPVQALTFSHDGELLATASSDGSARIWDVDLIEPCGQPVKHGEGKLLEAIAFNPDNRTIATAGQDGTTHLWDIGSSQPRGDVMKHSGSVVAVSFNSTGDTLATASKDGTVRLWNAKTGQAIGEPLRHGRWVNAISFSPDGLTLATVHSADGDGQGNALCIWDALSGESRGEPFRHDSAVLTVAFSPNGQTLATGTRDGTGLLWDVRTNRLCAELLKHSNSVRNVTFSPKGDLLATVADDYSVRLWETATGRLFGEAIKIGGGTPLASFHPDGSILAVANSFGPVRLWNVAQRRVYADMLTAGPQFYALAFSPDGSKLATASNGVHLWDVATGQLCCEPIRCSSLPKFAFSFDGRMIATASWDAARVWKVPPPVLDDHNRVLLSVQVRTGRTIEHGLIRQLMQSELQQKWKQLDNWVSTQGSTLRSQSRQR